MRMKWIVATVALTLAVGCSSQNRDARVEKKPTQRELATQEWNAARADVLHQLAQDQFRQGNLYRAEQSVAEAIRLQPKEASLYVTAAKLELERGRLESAMTFLSKARELKPELAEADYLAGVVHQRWQQPTEALAAYRDAARKDPTEVAYVLAESEMLAIMEQIDDAVDRLESRAIDFSNSAVLRDALGQLLVQRGLYGRAVEAYTAALALAPEDDGIRERLATAQFYNKDYGAATSNLERLTRDPAHASRAELFVMLGECQMQAEQYVDARSSFDAATRLNPSSPIGWLHLAKAALQVGDLRRAELSLGKSLALNPASGETLLMLGYVRLRQGRVPEAMQAFQKASAMDQKDSVSLCMIGYTLERQGRAQQAIQYYAQALKLNPDDELAAHLMAGIDDR